MDAEIPKVRTLSVVCDQCGAPLDVGEDSRYVTCGHCEAKLVVHHTGSAHWTARLDSLVEKTDDISRELKILRLERRIQAIDGGWRHRREQMMVRGRHGDRFQPTRGVATAFGGIGVFFFFVIGGVTDQWAMASLILLGTALMSVVMLSKARDFDAAESRWRRRRGKVRDKISALRRQDGATVAPSEVAVRRRVRRT